MMETHAMLNRLMSAIVPVLAVTLLVGCGAAERTAEGPATGIDPDTIAAVPIIDHAQGNDENLGEPRLDLIRSAEQLESLGVEIPLAEGLDFGEYSLVIFALGEQRTGGYWARITDAQQVGDTLWVQGIANAPADDEAATQQLTHPYAVAVIPRVEVTRVSDDIRSVQGQQPEAFSPAAAR